ncbi:expressed unknown protein [Ectocarpus siliculosus]|uniref:Mitochondrial import inner membrane translocase subunit n=1 Tax=Ectocarpus siliculosus TaxID=2880 RepID=D7FM41_ECTSI|nr:expressed unknown protein [Ectocarpus siliculosus]|eukprot:CBJ29866.1 expressed unknown protein [Ectocarpus siliculosus]
MEGRDQQAMQRKYQEMVAELDKIDAQLVRKAADSCTEACIGSTSLTNSEVVNACMRRCEASRPVLDLTVQQELTNLQVNKRHRFQSQASRSFRAKRANWSHSP